MTNEVDHSGLDLSALSSYLERTLGPLDGPLKATLIAGGRSNPTYQLWDMSREWILRRPPHGLVLETAHDMGREHRVLEALAGTSVPVPTPVAYCADASVLGVPFYVMEKIRGRTLPDRAATSRLEPSQRAGLADSMVSVLADLHEIDPAEVGLADWGRPVGYLSRQLNRWRKQWDAAHTRERDEIDTLFARLERALPTSRYNGIVHGDFKVDNMMVDLDDPSRIVGVLDWEMSTLGDTLTDLGLLISFWDQVGSPFNPLTNGATALDGFPGPRELLESYVERRGIDASDIDWYIAFADFKIAIILEQIHVRHVTGHTVGTGFDHLGDMVQPLLDRAIATTQSSSIAALRL